MRFLLGLAGFISALAFVACIIVTMFYLLVGLYNASITFGMFSVLWFILVVTFGVARGRIN